MMMMMVMLTNPPSRGKQPRESRKMANVVIGFNVGKWEGKRKISKSWVMNE
jgi:hypothetical protein